MNKMEHSENKEEEKMITIKLTQSDFNRLIKVIENERKNRDRAFNAWRKNNPVNPSRKKRNKDITYEIVNI